MNKNILQSEFKSKKGDITFDGDVSNLPTKSRYASKYGETPWPSSVCVQLSSQEKPFQIWSRRNLEFANNTRSNNCLGYSDDKSRKRIRYSRSFEDKLSSRLKSQKKSITGIRTQKRLIPNSIKLKKRRNSSMSCLLTIPNITYSSHLAHKYHDSYKEHSWNSDFNSCSSFDNMDNKITNEFIPFNINYNDKKRARTPSNNSIDNALIDDTFDIDNKSIDDNNNNNNTKKIIIRPRQILKPAGIKKQITSSSLKENNISVLFNELNIHDN